MATSTYLQNSHTGTGSSTGEKATMSVWVKRTDPSGDTRSTIIGARTDDNNYFKIRFADNDRLMVYGAKSGSTNVDIQTNREFRDTASWLHIVLQIDTTNATETERVKWYVNGELQTLRSTDKQYPSQNDVNHLTSASDINIGCNAVGSPNEHFDGTMSHFHLIDGTIYAPTVFGSTDSTTGEWKINTSPSVTYGSKGFFILKDGNSVTDQSGNGNDFTVAAGTLTNTEDCPSNNFSTLINEYPSDPTGGFANGNTTAKSDADSTWRSAFSSIATPPTGGKYYCEVKWSSGSHFIWGAVSSTTLCNNNFKDLTDAYTGEYMGYYGTNWYDNGASQGTGYGVELTSGNIGMMAMDRDNNKFWWGVNGSWGTGHNPATNTGGVSIVGHLDDFWHFAISTYSNSGSGVYEFNFGNGYFGTTAISSEGTNASTIGKFEYDVPSGFTALSTKGLNE